MKNAGELAGVFFRVGDGSRTRDNQIHNLVLYH